MPISIGVDMLADAELRECVVEARRRGIVGETSAAEALRRNLELAFELLAEGKSDAGMGLLRHTLWPDGGYAPAVKRVVA